MKPNYIVFAEYLGKMRKISKANQSSHDMSFQNNMVCVISKASDQPEYYMTVKLLTKHHCEFLSLKGGCTYVSESTFVKTPHFRKSHLSHDIASGSEITSCNKICKPLVVYRFSGNVMTSITTLRT